MRLSVWIEEGILNHDQDHDIHGFSGAYQSHDCRPAEPWAHYNGDWCAIWLFPYVWDRCNVKFMWDINLPPRRDYKHCSRFGTDSTETVSCNFSTISKESIINLCRQLSNHQLRGRSRRYIWKIYQLCIISVLLISPHSCRSSRVAPPSRRSFCGPSTLPLAPPAGYKGVKVRHMLRWKWLH